VEDSATDGGDERNAASAQTGKCAGGRTLDFGACAEGHVRMLAVALGRGISLGRALAKPASCELMGSLPWPFETCMQSACCTQCCVVTCAEQSMRETILHLVDVPRPCVEV